MEIIKYNKVNDIEIEVNNKRKLKMEFIQFDKKEYNKGLKITTLDEKDNKEKSIYINEADLVLLYNLYVYKKENGQEIF